MNYHYTMCGLDYVYLKSGYRGHDTEYGSGVSIERADELDRMIAALVITSHTRLRGQEVRFLRALMRHSQAEIANHIGVKRVTVARWETAPDTPIPGPADRVLRLLAAKHLPHPALVDHVIEMFAEITDERPAPLSMKYLPDEEPPKEGLFPADEPEADDGWRQEIKVA